MIEPSDSRNGFLISTPMEVSFNQAYLDIQPWSDDPYMDLLDSGEYEVLYANEYASLGFTKPMDPELANLFRSSNTLNSPNLRQQIAKIMENYDGENGPWYISGDESNIIIHNYGGPTDDPNGIVFKYQEEFGEVLSVTISENEVYGGTALAKARSRALHGDPLAEQTAVDLLPKPTAPLTDGEADALAQEAAAVRAKDNARMMKKLENYLDNTQVTLATDRVRAVAGNTSKEGYTKPVDLTPTKKRILKGNKVNPLEYKKNKEGIAKAKKAFQEAEKTRSTLKKHLQSGPAQYTQAARTEALDRAFKNPDLFLSAGRSYEEYMIALESYTKLRSNLGTREDELKVQEALRGLRIKVSTKNLRIESYSSAGSVMSYEGSPDGPNKPATFNTWTTSYGMAYSPAPNPITKYVTPGNKDYMISSQTSKKLVAGTFDFETFKQLIRYDAASSRLSDTELKAMYQSALKEYKRVVYTKDGKLKTGNRDFTYLRIRGNKISFVYDLVTSEANVDALELYQQQTNENIALVVEGLNAKIQGLGTGVASSFAAGKSAVNNAMNKMNRAKTLETQVQLKVIGRPSLCSGIVITLLNIGEKYSGKWYVKTCIHQIDHQGYTTSLTLIKNSKTKVLTKIIKTSIHSESGRDVVSGNVTVVNRNANGDLVETTMSRGEFYGQVKDIDSLMYQGASPEQIAAAKVLHTKGVTIGYYEADGTFVPDYEVIDAQVEAKKVELERLLKSQERKVRRTSQAYQAIKDFKSLGSQVSLSDPAAFSKLTEEASSKVGQLKSWVDNLNIGG